MTNCSTENCNAFSLTDEQLQQSEQLASLAKAIGHPARVKILKILIELDNRGGCLNSDLVSELDLAQSTVSEHLRILKKSQLITAEPIPPKMCYRVNRQQIEKVSTLFNTLTQ